MVRTLSLPYTVSPGDDTTPISTTYIETGEFRQFAVKYRHYSPRHAADSLQINQLRQSSSMTISDQRLTHLKKLEAESIQIMREVIAEFDNPAMLYSVGKDSSVMLHLAQKAFFPAPPPFPLVHVDATWKFREMIEFRDRRAKEVGMELIVHINPKGKELDISPFTHGSSMHTDIMKTEGLRQALDTYKYDAVFGGARRDEEKSRAKERVYSFRDKNHRWDPKNQRPD